MQLHIVTASTRPSRQGHRVAAWFSRVARDHGAFEIEEVDLAEVALPVYDEALHPRLGRYEHEHTLRWAETVGRADAFVFVTPEYNFGTPPALLNALTYLMKEWAYKPVGFVSYGGVSGGTRSVQMTKQIVTTLGMMPIPQAVSIPFFTRSIDDESGEFQPDDVQEKAAGGMLAELHRWAGALATLR